MPKVLLLGQVDRSLSCINHEYSRTFMVLDTITISAYSDLAGCLASQYQVRCYGQLAEYAQRQVRLGDILLVEGIAVRGHGRQPCILATAIQDELTTDSFCQDEMQLQSCGLKPYDQAPPGWDVEAMFSKETGLEPPLPDLDDDPEDIPW